LDTSEKKEFKTRNYRWLRRTLRILLGILIFLFLVILFIRSPWGQKVIVEKAVNYVTDKTGTKVAIDKLFITFDGDLQLDGLYLEDIKGDTLVYSKSVQANIPLWKMIRGEAIGVDALDWNGLRANIVRKDSISGYNFQFLVDAFAPLDTAAVSIDTASTPLDLVIGRLNFKDIDIVFDDAVIGIDSRFIIGELDADIETTNIEEMVFKVSDIALSNSTLKFIQKPVPIDTVTSHQALPKVSIENLVLNNVVAYYESQPDHIIANVAISEFSSEAPTINLADSSFDFSIINLKNSKISIITKAEINGIAAKTAEVPKGSAKEIYTFEWPQIKLNVSAIDFENNTFDYRLGNEKPKNGVFNPNAISVSNFTLKATDISLKDQKATLDLEQFNFNEISGLNLKQLALKFEATNKSMRVDGLNFILNNNSVSGNAHLGYNSISDFIAHPKLTKVDLNLPTFQIALAEIFKFQPDLKENVYLNTLSKKKLTGQLSASGTLASINLTKAEINWGRSTHISANGTLQNATNPEKLQFEIPQFLAETNRLDIIQFIDEKDLGISLPETIQLVANFSGNLQDISTKAKLISAQGNATLDGYYTNANTLSYEASVTVKNYKINELLNNPQFGALSMSIKSKGSGQNISTLDATLDAIVSEFQLNNYSIKDLNIKGTIKNGSGRILSKYRDENLNANLDAYVILDSIAPEVTVQLDVIGANLGALGLMQRDVKTGLKLSVDFKGNAENYEVRAIVDDGVAVYDKKTYLLGALESSAYVRKDSTSFSLRNKMINLDVKSNTDPQSLIKSLKNHVLRYFHRDEGLTDSITNNVQLKLKGSITQSPLLNKVFLTDLKGLDTVKIVVDFNENARHLVANITAPHINYSGTELDSLAFSMNTDRDNFDFNFGFKNIKAGPLDIPKTIIRGRQTNSQLDLNFLGYQDGEQIMNVNTKITGNQDRLKFSIHPENLILNRNNWLIPETNAILFTDKNLEFTDFKISKNSQSIAITDKANNIEKSHIAIAFDNFDINEVFSYFNSNIKLATGNLNGNFILEDPFANAGLIADISIEQFKVLKTDLGILRINGNSLDSNAYTFNAGLKGGEIDFDLIGDYTVTNNKANLKLDFDINEFKMKALNTLSMGEIKDTGGSFSGAFKVSGLLSNLQYDGALTFNNASFNIAKLNTSFTMVNETLTANNQGISMTDFTVLDQNNNSLVLSGNIGTKSFINPTFDLSVSAKNFQVLNATKEDNDMLYGKASFDAEATLTGDLQIPKLDAKLSVGSDTNITYLLPSTIANVEKRDGVVIFVNRENPNAILTKTEETKATIMGFDISTLINVGENSAITIVIDQETGDNFKVSGEGELLFTMKPNGQIALTGFYEISDGSYELSLYNLVNRKFLIAEGSRVTWSGDPFDAKLDVRAIYNVKTSASGLMATEMSGSDPSLKQKYKQVLPFNVYLNIDGELLQPEISFALDMPEDEQGAIGGQVYGKVQQVNNNEGELNRQVFSLLVLNSFYPDPSSDGSEGGFATLARDNLNDAVSDQLNAFSDKVLGDSGIELDFGLNSYTDYQGNAPTDRTQLDIAAQKKLFNDRLTVRVGSAVDIEGGSSTGEEAPIVGNVSLEYTLTEDGRYRLKGFRKSEFDNVFDGETVVNGIALIFTQEFNKFSELWDAILRSEKKASKAKEDALKAKQLEEKEVNESIELKKKN
jgi:translocation and assembly module TamB